MHTAHTHRLLDAGILTMHDFVFANNWQLSTSHGSLRTDHYRNAITAKFAPLPNDPEVRLDVCA